jgi:predicted O-methyltransferase YrrM
MLLARLFADAQATDAALDRTLAGLSDAERATVMTSSDYRGLYSRMKDFHLAVSRETGRLLYMLVRATGARAIVEFGTSFGISTLHLAAALKDNGGGRLIGTEFEPNKVVHARENIAAAGFAGMVEIREGDALRTLADDLPDAIDFVLLDGAKALYPGILSLVESRLHAGSLIVADNADYCPEYLVQVRSPTSGYLSVSLAGDVELSMKLNASEAVR